ncbi:MAG: 2-amino-4-hydroxy-6-hydroxymethyldihydropteridine diphosphokinase [Bacteroidales bacterium]|nr:2-amino-4-hydroxy-6-hydroxymethyldihydropteridine diphosphokinase [Bacteroidales bacterium]
MQKKELYLSLGANVGDRKDNILKATAAMEDFLKLPATCSRIMEFPSWGFCSSDFLNCVLRFDIPDSGADPELFLLALLRRIKEIERAFGRTAPAEFYADGSRKYHDRPIDIDILFYGKEIIDTEILKVPHPLAGVRNFVLEPLEDVATEKLKENFPFYF